MSSLPKFCVELGDMFSIRFVLLVFKNMAIHARILFGEFFHRNVELLMHTGTERVAVEPMFLNDFGKCHAAILA